MYVNYDLMIEHAKGELGRSIKELKFYQMYTSKLETGFTRKENIRNLQNRKRMFEQRVRMLEEQKGAYSEQNT
ncbi:MAG: hypothetical protein ABS893_01790 [Aerococcus urinaeequi]|uniref:hypothetical protein n=1 Tax=Leuconostoc TaxID=1243 RepID=UPI00186B6A5A|nr:hypothetical protein [Leuconostoc suionicum]MBE4727737.1 hypothetical protein [Leuconostoc suionicum]